jgi:hypothetical protein
MFWMGGGWSWEGEGMVMEKGGCDEDRVVWPRRWTKKEIR